MQAVLKDLTLATDRVGGGLVPGRVQLLRVCALGLAAGSSPKGDAQARCGGAAGGLCSPENCTNSHLEVKSNFQHPPTQECEQCFVSAHSC